MRRGPFLLLFAVSGAAALVYEVAWTRLLTLQLGHGVAAASTVLAAFMGGLAVGAAAARPLGARLSPDARCASTPVSKLAIAALALLLPFAPAAVRPLLAGAYADGDGGTAFACLRLARACCCLAAPAAAMGATFPIASRWAVRGAAAAAQDAGGLYAANTLGAAIGALLAGFVLLPALGLRLDVGRCGAEPRRCRRRVRDGADRQPGTPSHSDATRAEQRKRHAESARLSERRGAPARPWLAAAALGASGFASLTLQVVWTRLLAQILGPTTYAFSLVVAIFIIGLAGGAALGSRLAARTRNAGAGLAVCMLASVALALAAASSVDRACSPWPTSCRGRMYQFGDVLRRRCCSSPACCCR